MEDLFDEIPALEELIPKIVKFQALWKGFHVRNQFRSLNASYKKIFEEIEEKHFSEKFLSDKLQNKLKTFDHFRKKNNENLNKTSKIVTSNGTSESNSTETIVKNPPDVSDMKQKLVHDFLWVQQAIRERKMFLKNLN
ncbi:hypothetical protein HELRODRAFT_181722 [Helobdella robusta]|uniref:Uncharacterized protein n=1 Tax=Helobdella robusta TaxID=6412 RepID=T1FH94_HELRO|nr:hypothetical protein HELRODRAFT_181722 [Helobdella robusta]ESN92105.1 hypothetical protein HELRODRAFT_181722 [Helobdella robusta]